MHEMAIAESLLEMAREEIAAKGCDRILSITVHCGQIAGVMPDALKFAFEALVTGGPHEGAELRVIELPLILRCPFCQTIFDSKKDGTLFQACPGCGEEFGHSVEQGRELLLAQIEADKLP